MTLSVDELLQTLQKSRLLSDKQLGLVQDGVRQAQDGGRKKPLTAESITRRLVREDLITSWHEKMLLQKQSSFHLGQYRLLKSIGKGGMGKVFRAWDKKNKRNVAIKVLSGKLAKKPKLVARFRREVEVASKIDSPYIVRAFDAGEVGSSHFMVMEYVDGESIDQVADRLGRMRSDHACELTRQAALGLMFAHQQGMVHRDIKPANMMVAFEDDKLVVRLLDMGLARFEKADNDGMTRTGQVMGTPDYMAPEQGWNTADVDIRADIYSLGCSLFRLVTGQVPFPGDNPLQVLMARCSTDAPLASSIVPDLDPRVDAVIRRMTWRDPLKRYQTPEEVLSDITPLSVAPSAEDLAAGAGLEAVPAKPTVVLDASTQQEPSFQEFLRDVDSGAEVQLLQSMEGLSRSSTQTTLSSSSEALPQPPTRRWPLFAAIGLIVSLLVLGAIILSPREPDPGPVSEETKTQAPPPKIVYFAKLPVQRAQVGQAIGFFVAPEMQTGLTGITYSLDEKAPAEASLDENTGEFFWTPPTGQKPGRIEIDVLAMRGDKIEAETTILIDIQSTGLNTKIARFEEVEIDAGNAWQYQLKLDGLDAIPEQAKFLLTGNPPDGLSLNEHSGEIAWTPNVSQAGVRQFKVQLIDRTTSRVVDTAMCSVVVVPKAAMRRVKLPVVQAVVGQGLTVDLEVPRRLPPGLRWNLSEKAKGAGATLDAASGRFTWTPKAEHVGRNRFELQLSRNDRPLATALLAIVVAERTATTMPDRKSQPPDDEIAEAEKQVRQLFKRDFAQRSSSAKKELAGKLLIRSYDDQPDAMRFALLKLAMETAASGRAYGYGCEIAQRWQSLFKVDSVANVTKLVSGFKTRSTSKVDLAVLGEATVREALIATRSGRFESASKLLRVAASIARKSAYAPVIKQAQELLETLPDKDENATQLDSKQQLAREELLDLLSRYQFEPVFTNPAGVRFVQSDSGAANSGAQLWTIDKSGISLKADTQELITGFIDPAFNLTSFALRMQVKADSTSGVLILSAPGSGRMSGYQIPLVGTLEYSISQTGSTQSIAKPTARIIHDKSGWDLVEVAVMGDQIQISVNGSRVTDARLPEKPQGTIGVLADLRKTDEHSVQIRNIRVMDTNFEQ